MTAVRSALITGATGFIGSALVRRLLDENVEPLCLVRAKSANRWRLSAISAARIIEVSSFSLTEIERALAGLSAEVIFNLASYGVRQEDRDPQLLIEGNVGLLTNLLQATAHWPLRKFVHVGSCSEYGFPATRQPIAEDEPLGSASLYGAAKAASVLHGSALASGLAVPFVTLRLFGVFGVGEAPHRLIPYIVHRLQRDEAVDLTPGEQVRDLLYIDDVIGAFFAAWQQSLQPGAIYNVCSGRPVRIREVGEAVAAAMNKPRELLLWGKRPYRDNEPMWLVGDNRRFLRVTSWQPRITLEDGIERMVRAEALQKEYCPR